MDLGSAGAVHMLLEPNYSPLFIHLKLRISATTLVGRNSVHNNLIDCFLWSKCFFIMLFMMDIL